MAPKRMRRSAVSLEDIADWRNLAAAFYRASKGKRGHAEVQRFGETLDRELDRLRRDILGGEIALGRMTSFRINDPKPRVIRAPAFRERVLYHAIMAHAGPVLDRSLVFDSYACRTGKGGLAAVQRCQQHLRRFPWYGKIDIKQYFANIDHARLNGLLQRRFKDRAFLALLARIIDSHHATPGKGLPIGSLTSQHFANAYLDALDRRLLEGSPVRGMIRYMDDVIWWCDDKAASRDVAGQAIDFAREDLLLTVKQPVLHGRSRQGVVFCGYRVLPGVILLSRRRKRRYAALRRHYEDAFAKGRIGAGELQAGYAAALALTKHADAAGWRREQLRRHPLEPVLLDV